MNIIQDFIPKSNGNRPGHSMTARFITVHETSNTRVGANAEMHARYVKNPTTAASWHYTVDDGDDVYQHLPLNESGWHAGDGGSGVGNRQSIGIEICVNADGDFAKARANAIKLIRKLMKDLGIAASNVVPHRHWSGKNCPTNLLRVWDEFKAEVVEVEKTAPPAPTQTVEPKPPAQPALKSIEQLADEVIAGKHGTGDARRKALGAQFAAVQALVNEKLGAPKPTPPQKTVAQLAREVIDGKWGNGQQRTQRLTNAGHNASAVQAEVNRILGANKPARKSVDQIAREVIAGKWGNNPQRSAKLKAAGYDAAAVQRRVNQLLR